MIPFEHDPERGRHEGAGGRRGGEPPGPDEAGREPTWGGRLRGFFEAEQSGRTRVLEFPLRHAATAPTDDRETRGAWLVPPLMLAAIAAGVLFVLRGPDDLFGIAFALVLALGILWILVSSLLPGRAERTCPDCDGDGLERMDPLTTQGLRCRLCGWEDESASSFLLAEEEGPLEDIVLRERGRRW